MLVSLSQVGSPVGGYKTKQFARLQDDPQIYHGAPVGLQIVGRGLQEERILSIAGIVLDALKGRCSVV